MVQYFDLKVIVFLAVAVDCEYASNVIDVDDILAEDYMPGTLLVLENPTNGVKRFNESIKNVDAMEKLPDGSFGNAMDTMNFHRSMMNQYLCRNFVAEQIIRDMTTSRVDRRMGHITPGSEPSKFKSSAQNNMLNDEGSSNYKNWLAKSATLEDIYRHYDQAQNRLDAEIIEEDDKGEDFDEEYNGHATGYVYPQPHEGHSPTKHRGHTGLGMYYAGGGGYPYPNPIYHQHGGSSDYHHGGGSGYQHGGGASGYHYGGSSSHGSDLGYHDGGFGDAYYSQHDSNGGGHAVVETIYHSGPPKYHGQHDSSYGGGKDHDLSDLFDIALTALAFLSFGLFIVHVIICISAATHNTTTTAASMIMPMSMSPTATATGTGNGGGGSMTSTGGGGTGGGTTSTGTGSGSTGTGAGMTATGGGSTSMGGGDTGPGGGDAGTGGDGGTGGGNTGTGGGDAGTGGGDIDGGGGGGNTGTGGGDAGTGGGDIDGGGGGGNTGTGGGDTDGGTGGGDIDGGGGSTGTGGETGGGSDTTGGASPGSGTGTGAGTTGDGNTGGGTATGGDGNTGTGSGRDTFKFRLRRDIPTITNPNNQALNELARRVLTSIEAALVANSDNGVCLQKSLCENNKHSRDLEGKDKLIIPMWSLGMSWLAGRLIKNVSSATSMLDTLKASILGLGKANCEIVYQECDLRKERRKRRRKRRK